MNDFLFPDFCSKNMGPLDNDAMVGCPRRTGSPNGVRSETGSEGYLGFFDGRQSHWVCRKPGTDVVAGPDRPTRNFRAFAPQDGPGDPARYDPKFLYRL